MTLMGLKSASIDGPSRQGGDAGPWLGRRSAAQFFSSIQSAIAAQEGRSLTISANKSAIQRQQRHGELWKLARSYAHRQLHELLPFKIVI